MDWTCPIHGTARTRTSPKGLRYIGCQRDDCREFARVILPDTVEQIIADLFGEPRPSFWESRRPLDDDLPF